MERELIFTIPSMFRDDFKITGFRFGKGRKSLCVVGSLRGNEYQQIYVCGQLVNRLKQLESDGMLTADCEILVIPSLNPASMNIGERFWPTDKTDINRMFPGYALGETTQRIAEGVFQKISAYENGIQLASFYMPGRFAPHVRYMNTGFGKPEKAEAFGIPYIVKRIPRPYDTTTLNYNWQLWDTDAFSLYTTMTTTLDDESKDDMIAAILRFMTVHGMVKGDVTPVTSPRIFHDKTLVSVRPTLSGIFQSHVSVNQRVTVGTCLAEIIDPCEGHIIQRLTSPVEGTVFFRHDAPLVYANTAVIKLLPNIE